MKKTKQVNVLKHFNDKYDSRVKEVMKTKKKFMDGGTAGVVSDYNQVKYGGQGANAGVGKSYMSPNPAPAFKKGGMKKYQGNVAGSQTGPSPSTSSAPATPPKPMSKEDYKAAKRGVKQQARLNTLAKRGTGANLDKAAKVATTVGSIVGTAAGIKNLLKKNTSYSPSGSSGAPGYKKGGSTKSKKRK